MARVQAGYSLVELVLVITIAGALSAAVAGFIAGPFAGIQDSARRAELAAAADGIARRISRDLRAALPNSIRVSGPSAAVELLHTVDGGRYRRDPGINTATATDHSAAGDWLDFTGDISWNLMGRFGRLAFSYGTPLPAGHRLAIYTTGSNVWADAATGASPGVITPAGTAITLVDDGDEDQIQLAVAHRFRFQSPRRRLYVVDAPVSYVCDTASGTLTRYAGYAASAAQPTNGAAPPLSSAPSAALLADRLASCALTYVPGTPSRAGLVTLELGVAASGEQVTLLRQVHVENAP